MRLKKISSSLILLSIIFLAGCEGRFAGERAYNIQILNGNYQMKVVTVAGAQYLAVLNTNFRFQASTGSLQFYTLANPQLPVLQASMTLELPSNAGDFEFDGDTLYVADRNLHRILIYDFASGAFKARLDANANPVTLIVTDQPQTLFVLSRPSDQIKVLAVVCQG
ncbi:MAG: hypothetical protein JWQ35_2546, partial [Bacteriovoracaceae bacterium]|nr:hypothetical protein [Bacteriovoracaceae bacterium]